MMKDVFLSYSRLDFEQARQLRDDLLSNGVPVWWDQDILPGQNWKDEIHKAIKGCRAFVFCLSEKSVARARSWFYKEVLSAINIYREFKPGEVFIIPVRFSECDIPDFEIDGMRRLPDLQYVDLFPPEVRARHLPRLLGTLQEMLGISSEPEAIKDTKTRAHSRGSWDDERNVLTKIEILIKRDFEVFKTGGQYSQLRNEIEDLLGKDAVRFSIQRGSVRLILELSPIHAYRLLWAIGAGRFNQYDVEEARLKEDEEPEEGKDISSVMSNKHMKTMKTKAVVFTHFGSLEYRKGGEEFPNLEPIYEERYREVFESYFNCPSISRVYIYVDWAFKQVVKTIRDDGSFRVPPEIRREETALIGTLNVARHMALQRYRDEGGKGPIPQFEIVGIDKLQNLLHELFRLDPDLIRFLCGPTGQFTYDSPKFIEAIIRLAFGDSPLLARYPIIRIDEDASPNNEAAKILIDQYEEEIMYQRFFFFSGTYGIEDKPVDYVNDFAVRTHWFAPIGTKKGQDIPDLNEKVIRYFLADLDALGPRQLLKSRDHYTKTLQQIVSRDMRLGRVERPYTQVISGAGLIMSSRAVRFLPPFMNFENLTSWVDDHLKRRLHEALGDLGRHHTECISKAKFDQNRHTHPEGVRESDMHWAIRVYFDRLLRGCILRRIITQNDGKPTRYSELVAEIVRFKVTGFPPALVRGVVKDFQGNYKVDPEKVDLDSYEDEMLAAAKERYDEALESWSASEYDASTYNHAWEGYEGSLRDWALSRQRANRQQANGKPNYLIDPDDHLVPKLLLAMLKESHQLNETQRAILNYLSETKSTSSPHRDINELKQFAKVINNLKSLIKGEGNNLPESMRKLFEDEQVSSMREKRELLQKVFPGTIPWWNHKARTCEAVVDDALGYVRLLLNWHMFVRAIEQLAKSGIDWLYPPGGLDG